jgi:cation diffusion facilitator family transporter
MNIATSSNSHERTLLVAVGVCFVDVLLTGGAALASNSLTILSDAFKEGTDFLAMLASYFTLRAVRRSPHERFAYGIGKLENLVSMAIAVMMVACAGLILVQASHAIRFPKPIEGTLPGIVIFSTYAVIGFGIFFRNRLELRKRESAILASQAQLWFAKATFDGLMAATLIAEVVLREQSWSRYLDPLASLVGVFFLLHAAWSIASSSVGDLLDASLTEHLQLRILRQLIERFDDYDKLHKIRTRRSGSRVYVEVFLQFDAQLLMGEVQRRIDALSELIRTEIPGTEVVIVPSLVAPAAPVA